VMADRDILNLEPSIPSNATEYLGHVGPFVKRGN
jgi:hypothetical protein